jgi:hypothetical protein
MLPTGLTKNFLMLLCISLGVSAHAGAQEQSCIVNEVTNAGGYTYIGCQKGSNQIWLATPQITLQNGERISFQEAPPLANFNSKAMGRTFESIAFVPGVSRIGSSVPNSNSQDPSPYNDTYVGIEENGTMVFTDNHTKASNSPRLR